MIGALCFLERTGEIPCKRGKRTMPEKGKRKISRGGRVRRLYDIAVSGEGGVN